MIKYRWLNYCLKGFDCTCKILNHCEQIYEYHQFVPEKKIENINLN